MLKTKMKSLDLLLIVVVWLGIIPLLTTIYAKYAILALIFYQLIILLYLTYEKITYKTSSREHTKTS